MTMNDTCECVENIIQKSTFQLKIVTIVGTLAIGFAPGEVFHELPLHIMQYTQLE
jgi:hypothetical protein